MEEDGCDIEPVTYAPIIPMALTNGCTGIATGCVVVALLFLLADLQTSHTCSFAFVRNVLSYVVVLFLSEHHRMTP